MNYIDKPVTTWTEPELAVVMDPTTGETWGQALTRFATFGPLLTARDVVSITDEDAEVMSFGYGDGMCDEDCGPGCFEGISVSTLLDAIAEGDTLEDLDRQWGPFAIWK